MCPAYAQGAQGAQTGSSSLEGAAGGQIRVCAIRYGTEDTDANAVSAQDIALRRTVVSAGTTTTEDKFSTRSRTNAAQVRFGVTAADTGSPLVQMGSETHANVFTWRPPSPNAAPILTDTEHFIVRGTSRAKSELILWDEDAFPRETAGRGGARARRGRRPGVWHYRNCRTERLPQKTNFNNRHDNWCAPVETRPWRERNAYAQLQGIAGTVTLACVVAGQATMAASLKVTRPLQAAVAGIATVATAVKVTRPLQAGPVGAAIVAAALAETRPLQAAPIGAATVTANLSIQGAPGGGLRLRTLMRMGL